MHGKVAESETAILYLTVNQKVCTFAILFPSFCLQRLFLRVQHQHVELLNLSVLHIPSAFVLPTCKSYEKLRHIFCSFEQP